MIIAGRMNEDNFSFSKTDNISCDPIEKPITMIITIYRLFSTPYLYVRGSRNVGMIREVEKICTSKADEAGYPRMLLIARITAPIAVASYIIINVNR